MSRPWRPIALGAALYGFLGVEALSAQTVIVRNAPAGSAIELVLNADTVATATADATGQATLSMDLRAKLGKPETDAYVYLDVCQEMRKVLIVERGAPFPPEGAGCERRQIGGLYWLREVSTFVLNLGGLSPTVRLRQGPPPAQWLTDEVPEEGARQWRPSPTGLVLFGGGGFATVRDFVAFSCGNVTECEGDGTQGAITAGATYWFFPFAAAEVSYLKPNEAPVSGSGDGYRFTSFFDTHVVTIAGKGGIPIGPVRIYGQLGFNYHRARSGTTQTIDERTVTNEDGVTVTLPGGTQSYQARTSGWGWAFGGGLEGWITNRFAIYGEVGRAGLKGSARDDSEVVMDEGVTSYLFGLRMKIGR